MTLLITGPYRGRPSAFFLNRFLRLYPLYWATFGLAVALNFAIPDTSISLLKQALFIVRYNDNPIFVPAAWAVTNEIVFYVLIGFGISKTLHRSVAWLALSCVATSYAVLNGSPHPLDAFFFPAWCASLPFSLGSVLFHLRYRFLIPVKPVIVLGGAAILNVGAMGACTYSFYQRQEDWLMFSVYASLLPNAAIVLTLFRLRTKRLRAIDDQIGRLSYPVYLMQFLGASVAQRIGISTEPSLRNAVTVLLVTVALSIAFLILIDGPVQSLRKIIRLGGDARETGSVIEQAQ